MVLIKAEGEWVRDIASCWVAFHLLCGIRLDLLFCLCPPISTGEWGISTSPVLPTPMRFRELIIGAQGSIGTSYYGASQWVVYGGRQEPIPCATHLDLILLRSSQCYPVTSTPSTSFGDTQVTASPGCIPAVCPAFCC